MKWTRVVSVLCALALTLAAFAHRPAAADARLSDPRVALSLALALGDALSDLCLSGGAADDGAVPADCPACTLAKSMALGPAGLDPSGMAVWSVERAARPEAPRLAGQGPRAPPARGPPLLRLI